MQKVASADMEARYLPLACRDRSVTASVCCVKVLCRGNPDCDSQMCCTSMPCRSKSEVQSPVRETTAEWQGTLEESFNAADATAEP